MNMWLNIFGTCFNHVSLCSFYLDTDEELKEWQTKFEERIALLLSKISKLEREMNDEETKSSSFSQTINESMREIGKLQAEADVMCCFYVLYLYITLLYTINTDINIFQAHMSLRHERDSTIQRIFTTHNLGFLPDTPFSEEVAANLTNRIKTRLLDLEKDLEDKKVCLVLNINFLYFL